MDELARLLRDQDGLVSRAQALGSAVTRTALARSLRRGDLVVVHPGVYVDHNGPLTWQQRAWAAVLHASPAALCLDSALRAAEGPGRRQRDEDVLHVAIEVGRRVRDAPGVQVHRMVGFEDRVQVNASPPRIRYDESVLDVAAGARRDLDAVAVLAEACGSRRTTASRLLDRLAARPRIARRAWLEAVLRDVADGTCSVLEHAYRSRVVRPHGLPMGRLQVARLTNGGAVHRDVTYDELALVVELDGRAFHSALDDRDRDLDRDLDTAVEESSTTVRLGFGQVVARACATAGKLGVVMGRGGWAGTPTRCPECGTSDQAG